MKILIVSATTFEIAPLLERLSMSSLPVGLPVPVPGRPLMSVLITGVGMMQAAYYLGRAFSSEGFEHVVQAGIAGSFRNLDPGKAFTVSSQAIGDLGADDGTGFKDTFDMGLTELNQAPFTNGLLVRPFTEKHLFSDLPEARAVSVNMVTSNFDEAARLTSRYMADLEVMEGAALHYACLLSEMSYEEVRTVSNRVGEQDRGKWHVREAIEMLNSLLIKRLNL